MIRYSNDILKRAIVFFAAHTFYFNPTSKSGYVLHTKFKPPRKKP
jgi:hypothetical protein